ncbi:hypothetical protein BFP70_14085 [Thioclava sp. SK-1]|nr:hypothetical protein BFP70_14085 [Thioclava sp. SK-1]
MEGIFPPVLQVSSLGLILDLIGTYVFGLSGAVVAVRRRLDLFGIMVLAVAAALAGGMIRDMALGSTPPAALRDSRYLVAAMLAGATGFFFHHGIERVSKPVMVLDALGLGLFAITGAGKALLYGLSPIPAVMLGVLTATGGGAVRDLLVAEIPRVLREEVYAMAALVGAAIYVAGGEWGWPGFETALIGIAATVILRIVSVWRGWSAPRAPGSDSA